MKKKMQLTCRLILAVLFAAVVVGPMTPAFAYPRAAGGTAQTITDDAGNTLTPFNTSVGTTTAVALYTKTANRVDRKIKICNDQAATYVLLLSTSSGIAGTATQDTRAHDAIQPATCAEFVPWPQTMYGVFRSSSTSGTFSGGRAFGYKRYDSRD